MFQTPVLFFDKLRKDHPHLTAENIHRYVRVKDGDKVSTLLHRMRLDQELSWREERKPYYKVYPKILSALCRVNLNLSIESIHYPVNTLMILLPHGHKELTLIDGEPLTALLVRLRVLDSGVTNFHISPYTRNMPIEGLPCGLSFCCGHGQTIEDALTEHSPLQTERDFTQQIKYSDKWTRLAVALSLLGQDSDVIIPDVINGDEVNDKNVDRAHRRGKIGWLIGEGIEQSPHVRIPHLFHACVGAGRKQRKLMWRKGSVIHRDKIKSIPTGFGESTPIEPTT